MKRIESFRWWINDYMTSTVRRRCSLEARGLYLDILMLLYSSPRPGYACETVNGTLRYLDQQEILSDVGADDRGSLFAQLETWGALIRDEDGWYNPKAVEVAENEIDFREKKRESGRKGGIAKATNAKQRSSGASSSASGSLLANVYPPDPDPDPDPDPESESPTPLSPPSPWGGTTARGRQVRGFRTGAMRWFQNGQREEAEELLERAHRWEVAKQARPHVDTQRARMEIEREWERLIGGEG